MSDDGMDDRLRDEDETRAYWDAAHDRRAEIERVLQPYLGQTLTPELAAQLAREIASYGVG